MTITSNAHTHTTYCDGANTPAEMAAAAFALGFKGLGFSGHSPAAFDPTCPGISNETAYRSEIAGLKEQYEGKMAILCGVEQDYYAPVNRSEYDYIVGSVHYLPGENGQLVAIDGAPEHALAVRNNIYGGNGTAMARAFYELTVANIQKYKPDIVGHFDLLVKYNGAGQLLDEQNPAYREVALQAADAAGKLLKEYGGIVEINTGVMARGWRNAPYPAGFILRHLAQMGVRVMVNGDSHNTQTLNYGFDTAVALTRQAGFKSIVQLQKNGFVDEKLV